MVANLNDLPPQEPLQNIVSLYTHQTEHKKKLKEKKKQQTQREGCQTKTITITRHTTKTVT